MLLLSNKRGLLCCARGRLVSSSLKPSVTNREVIPLLMSRKGSCVCQKNQVMPLMMSYKGAIEASSVVKGG